jgi:hypothetical protein
MNPQPSNRYIETPEGEDRGRALYEMHRGAVTQMVLARKGQWFKSDRYTGLKNMCTMIDRYIDGTAVMPGSFATSDINPQTINKAYEEYLALFEKFFETDPLYSVRKQEGITVEQERAITGLITSNLEKTYYREQCFQWTLDQIVRYGTSGTYTFAVDDYNSNSLMTVRDESAYDDTTYKQIVQPGSPAVLSTAVHPLNIIMDPFTSFMTQPDFKGLLADILIADLIILSENPLYIPESIKEVIDKCKNGMRDEYWFNGKESDKRDFTKGHTNISYLWTRLPFEGNEADNNWYAVEEIAGEIIRIEQSNIDNNIIPLSIQRVRPRPETWYGNSVLMPKVPIQNLLYTLLNMNVESTIRAMDRVILYPKNELSIPAMNSRHTTGGFVPYEGNRTDLSSLMFSPAFPNNAYRENEYLWGLARREDQDSSAMPNFNPQAEGGPTNKTLGGAQMMASIGEMKMTSHISKLCSGLKDVPKHQLALLVNIMPDNDPAKQFINSNISWSVKTSNVFNYIREGIDTQNRLTQLINYLASGIQGFSAVKISQFIKDWVRNSVKRENIEDYYDENVEQQLMQAAMMPQVPQQAAIPGQQQPQMPPQGAMQGGPM